MSAVKGSPSQFLDLPLVSLGNKPEFPYPYMENVYLAFLWVVRRIRCIKSILKIVKLFGNMHVSMDTGDPHLYFAIEL